MIALDLEIPDVKVFTPDIYEDDRGYFFESFRASWLPGVEFVQDNQSLSSKNTLRGLHYQLENPQGKLVRVIKGAVFDIAVDLRRSSDHFGRWIGRTLTQRNREIFWVPPGFAHGFLVLTDRAEFVYKCTNYYTPGDEYTIAWDDPTLGIDWPTETLPPVLSDKDRNAPTFEDCPIYP